MNKNYLKEFPELSNYSQSDIETFFNFFSSLYLTYKEEPLVTRNQLCLYCNNTNCIKSHSISEGVLNSIASKDKNLFKFNDTLYYLAIKLNRIQELPYFENLNNSSLILQDVSSSYASAFDGFCAKDDNKLFKSLDDGDKNPSFSFSRYYWELLYRTIAFKIRFIEQFISIENKIISFMKENSSFSDIWNIIMQQQVFQNMYVNLNNNRLGLMYLKNSVKELKTKLTEIKSYEFNLILFEQDYYFYSHRIFKKDVRFLSCNYIEFSRFLNNHPYIDLLKSDLLVSKIGIKFSKKFRYYNILGIKKNKKNELDSLLSFYNENEIINSLVIDSKFNQNNTFFKRKNIKRNQVLSNRERKKLGSYLLNNHYSNI